VRDNHVGRLAMQQARGRLRSGVVAGLSMVMVVGAALSAFASHGNDGDPISEVPDLFADGAAYGTIKDHDDSTEPNGKEHERRCCNLVYFNGEGGSVYKFTAKIGTKVQVDVTDDIAGESLNEVEIFRQHLGEDTLPAFYGFPEVHDYLVAFDSCPGSNSVCRAKWVIPEDDTYYLAFWPDSGDSNYATFRFSISVRKPTKTKLSIEGASKPVEPKCFRVSKGGSVTANARVTADATGTVKFRLERRQKGNWKLMGTDDVALVDSKASLEEKFNQAGRYRLRAEYLGDDWRAPSKSKKPCFQAG
jgi:hypothetical protein